MFRLAITCCVLACAVSVSLAQEAKLKARFESSILDDEPFDLLTLTAEWKGAEFRVFPGAEIPTSPDPESEIDVKLSIYPDRLYRISWKDIAQFERYESLLLSEAKRLMRERQFAPAFEHLNFLRRNYPDTPGLDALREEFLLTSALEAIQSGNLAHAFTILEEFARAFPGSQRTPQVRAKISDLAGKMIEKFFTEGQLTTARLMISRLENDYSSSPLPVVAAWKQKFIDYADTFRQQALKHQAAGNFPDARTAAAQMLSIAPEIEGGQSLMRDLILAYPMVRVGVFQKAERDDITDVSDWPVRRTGSLVAQSLFEFRNSGAEGGTYKHSLGSFVHSDDRTELMLKIANAGQQGIPTAYELSQWMLRRADTTSSEYRASWAAIMKQVRVESPDALTVQLYRPHVLPHAFLQWPMDELQSNLFKSSSFYRRGEDRVGNRSSFRWAKDTPAVEGQPIEIVEQLYSDPRVAVADLIRGEVEFIDRLFPADVLQLKGKREIKVESYALPMVHMLVPISDHPFLKDRDFRRALMYATNRQAILDGEILGGVSRNDTRLISGPFPIGSDENDPLAYAYNKEISPIPFDPKLAQLLVILTKQKLTTIAKKANETPPELTKLRIGIPDYEAARVAGAAFVQQWAVAGIPAELVPLPSTRRDAIKEPIDLLYISAALWEPATDAERLFGEGGIAATENVFIVQVLANLRSANNWREVRQFCQDLHTLIASHLPVLPLWQVGESFAYRNMIQGVSKSPVTLYQDVQKWRMTGAQ
jgi:tetratricopeptide (TPR) repeat protein